MSFRRAILLRVTNDPVKKQVVFVSSVISLTGRRKITYTIFKYSSLFTKKKKKKETSHGSFGATRHKFDEAAIHGSAKKGSGRLKRRRDRPPIGWKHVNAINSSEERIRPCFLDACSFLLPHADPSQIPGRHA